MQREVFNSEFEASLCRKKDAGWQMVISSSIYPIYLCVSLISHGALLVEFWQLTICHRVRWKFPVSMFVLQLSNAEPCAHLMLTHIRHVHLSGSRWALLGFCVLFLLLPTTSFLMRYFSTLSMSLVSNPEMRLFLTPCLSKEQSSDAGVYYGLNRCFVS